MSSNMILILMFGGLTLFMLTGLPIAFVLEYDTAQIKPQMSYVVQATIRQGGKLLFINTERFAVLTRGAPQDKVRVRVDPV